MRTTPRLVMAVLLMVGSLSLVTACSDNTAGSDSGVTFCENHEDCPTGMFCQDGVCTSDVVACDDAGTCPDGMVCLDGTCIQDNDGGMDGDGGDGADGDPGGDAPDIEVIEPALSEDIHQLNFGNVLVGETVTQQVVLANAGTRDLSILQLNFEMGTDIEDFSLPQEVLDALPIVVAPGAQTVFDILYTASDGHTDHGILDVISNDPDEALVQIHLLSEFKGEARVEVAPRALPFGDMAVGATSMPLTFTISNSGTGNAVLSVDDVRPQILANPNFSLTITDADGAAASAPILLNNNDFLDVAVVFHPQQEGLSSDDILVLTDDLINPSVTVAVEGTGVVGDLVVNPSPIALGRIRVNDHVEQLVSITNGGGADFDLTGVALQGGSAEWTLTSTDLDLVDLVNNPHTLAPSQTASVLLAFDPIDVGLEGATLLIDNTSADPQRQVAVSAEGYVPAAVETVPAPPELSFGNVQLDFGSGTAETAILDVVIRNVGGEALQIIDIQRSAGLDFSFDPATIPPIDVGLEVPLHVSFSPSQLGSQTGSILVDTNDPDIDVAGFVGRFQIDMQANGIDPNIFVSPAAGKDFGDVYVGQVASQEFIIQNSGFGPLVIESIELSPGSSGSFDLINLPALPVVITNSMMTVNFDLTYLPASLGTDTGAIEIVSSDIGNPNVLLNISGNGADCPPNQIDCDGNPQTGCERTCITTGAELCNNLDDDCDCDVDEDFDLTSDPAHCGSCAIACSYPNGTPTCINSACELLTCLAGWDNCDGQSGNGCEIHTDSDVDYCGDCATACNFANADASCLAGTCVMGSCDPGFANCDGSDLNGCEVNLQSDPDNCNNCGNQCQYDHGIGVCAGGLCFLNACVAPWQNCNFPNNLDGCEVNLDNDPLNCNSCNNVCPASGGNPVCVGGICGVSGCDPGFEDCDLDGIDCEIDIANDPNNCGACAFVCNLANASADCVAQNCVVDTCDPSFGNCDGQDSSGCETDLTSDGANCGFCGNNCQFDHASASCVGSTCQLGTCDPGYYNTDNDPTNGCECQADSITNWCLDADIADIGVLSNGAVEILTGNLVPAGDEDWYTFTAPDNHTADVAAGSDNYHVQIEFDPGSGNPDNVYAFDIFRNENTGAGCAAKGTRVCDWSDVTYNYLAGQNPCWMTTNAPGPNLCRNDTARYWIRVYRTGALVNCSPYIINITFTQ